MEIEQYLYDLTESGDAIVAYTMRSASGGYVQICNLGATVLAWSPDLSLGDIASGSCVRGVRGMESDLWGGVRFSELMWESRVEVNRVVMALQYESEGVGIMCEVVFDYDDDNTLEITYIASPDDRYELDFTHKLTFDLGDGVESSVMSDEALSDEAKIYSVAGAKRSILSNVATIGGGARGVELLSSQGCLYRDVAGSMLVPVAYPAEIVEAQGRYIQKNVYRYILK